MPTVKANGINMYYELHGGGEPLVIINGLGGSTTDFRTLPDELAKTHKVLIFDNRGAGRSDKPDEPYSLEQMATDAAELMKKLKIGRANVLGISMGGRIALELTLAHPELVNRLIMISSSARVTRTWQRRFFIDILGRLRIADPQPRYAFNRQREASQSYDASNRLSEIKVPTLIMNGRSDKLAPWVLAEELHAGIKGSKLVGFNGGHLFFAFSERYRALGELNGFIK